VLLAVDSPRWGPRAAARRFVEICGIGVRPLPAHIDRIGHPRPRNDERERKGDTLTCISFAGAK